MDTFISTYKRANTIRHKIMCVIAKLTHGKVVTPLGRIVLLPKDYNRMLRQ